MTDLCYNCGDCHLPSPCLLALKQCEICHSYGHTYNFCPLGVRIMDDKYQYWALCHNCDKWHMPDPCPVPFHSCKQCHHGGHLEVFCPFKPIPRRAKETGQKAGTKRQRTSGSDSGEASVNPDVAHKLKMSAALQFIDLLNRGFNPDQILHIFQTTAGSYVLGKGNAAHSLATPDTPTPAPIMSYGIKTEGGAPGLYSIQHDRFNRGDLAQPHPRPVVQYASPYSETFHQNGSEAKGPADNINVGAASALQNLAQSAVAGAMPHAEHSVPQATTAGGEMVAATSAPNFHDKLLNSDTHLQAHQASIMPEAGFQAVNNTMGEPMPVYQGHILPSQAPGDAIAVGSTPSQAEEDTPQLALRKDGQPKKRQPAKRQQPRRNNKPANYAEE